MIKLAKGKLGYIWLAVLAAVLALLGAFMITHPSSAPSPLVSSQMTDGSPRVNLTLGDGSFRARVVVDPSEREHGLSGTRSLADDDAMLFVFESDDKWGFWMKDMYIPIDIIWLDSDKRVVYIAKQVDPSTFPKAFEPSAPARYVVELKSGAADAHKLEVGSQAQFEVPEAGR